MLPSHKQPEKNVQIHLLFVLVEMDPPGLSPGGSLIDPRDKRKSLFDFFPFLQTILFHHRHRQLSSDIYVSLEA